MPVSHATLVATPLFPICSLPLYSHPESPVPFLPFRVSERCIHNDIQYHTISNLCLKVHIPMYVSPQNVFLLGKSSCNELFLRIPREKLPFHHNLYCQMALAYAAGAARAAVGAIHTLLAVLQSCVLHRPQTRKSNQSLFAVTTLAGMMLFLPRNWG